MGHGCNLVAWVPASSLTFLSSSDRHLHISIQISSTSSRHFTPNTPHNSSQELITSFKMGKDSFAPGTLPSLIMAH